jgi:signal transduction histidine kinase
LYTILSYQLVKEVDKLLGDRISHIVPLIRETTDPPECNRRFLEYIVSRRRYDFYDLREITDAYDDKYLFFVYCGDRLRYISEKYQDLESVINTYDIEEQATQTLSIGNIPFRMKAIPRIGYSIYLGYDLSSIREVQRRVQQIFMFVIPGSILISLLCGYYVTHRSLRVINAINRTAGGITSKNLDERMELPRDKDEITELIRTLNSMIERLEKSFKMVQQFSCDAAHEIRTPLTIVRGEIEELLRDENCAQDTAEILESILEEIQYLSSISDKLLLIHGLDTGEIQYHFKELNIGKIVEEIFNDAKVLASGKNISAKLDKCDEIKIFGDEELIVRLLWNLIDNAVKYTNPGGNVAIAAEVVSNKAKVSVEDNGIGIGADHLPRIFERFYRVDRSRSRERGGSGLGLAICKWIVELHKGEIGVESELGKGSKFIVSLPLA